MKYTVVLTLVISLVFVGFGGFLLEAQGVNNEVRPGNIDQINEQRITYQQIYNGTQNIIEIERQQAAEIKILLNEYYNKRNQIIDNTDYNKDELRNTIITNGTDKAGNMLNDDIVNLREGLTTLKNEYEKKMRSVLNNEQLNKISQNNYVLNIGTSVVDNKQSGVKISGYPIQGMATMNRFTSNASLNQTVQCTINAPRRSY